MWVDILSASLHRRLIECKLPFIRKFPIPSHCSSTKSRQYETSKQADEPSFTIQFLHGSAHPNILYISLIILKFTSNRCNKIKVYMVSFIDYIIMFSESIGTFPGTSLQSFCKWDTNMFCLTGWG